MRFPIVVLTCSLALPAYALDATIGDIMTCKTWLQERAKEKAWFTGHNSGEPMPTGTLAPSAWVLGYLQGLSSACPKQKPLADGLDSGAVFSRIDQFCKSHGGQETTLHLAVIDLVVELPGPTCPAD
jgi:hypothetical protein